MASVNSHEDIMQSFCGAPNEAALLCLMERTGYHMLQENGQRKYGPPPNWTGPPPQRGCEIFVGKIPRDCYEDELVPAFERCGRIYEFRLMMDFSGSNRGYCFVTYTCRDDARRAVTEMDNYEIRRGRFLGVCMSVDNCRLFVGGIPKNKQQDEILEEMTKVTEGVIDVIVYPSANDKTKNRGFAFVEYASHRAAAMARRKLIPGRIQLWGHQIAVDWAEPEKEVDEDTMSRVKVLYVRNLMPSTPEEVLSSIFNMAAGRDRAVERVKKIRDFAFIHFHLRDDAERALNIMNRKEIDGVTVEVVLAKPVDKNSYTRYTRSCGKFPSSSSDISSSLEQQLQCLSLGKAFISSSSQNTQGTEEHSQRNLPAPSSIPLRMMSSLPRVSASSGQCFTPNSLINEAISQGSINYFVQNALKKYGEAERAYDTAPAIEQTPSYPSTIHTSFSKMPVQILEELFLKNGWESPKYQLHRTLGCDGSGDIQLFLFKVLVPHLRVVFTPNKLSSSIDKAQNIAAEHVLQELIASMEGQGVDTPVMMTYGSGNAGCSNETLNLLRAAGLPMALHHYSNGSTPSDTTGLTDLQQATPATTSCTVAPSMYPLTSCRMNVNAHANALGIASNLTSPNPFHY